jgi:hypothetical protein
MTKSQALAKAKMIWGKNACVVDAGSAHVLPNGHTLTERYKVGHITSVALPLFHVKGDGKTWEEAFAKAEKN